MKTCNGTFPLTPSTSIFWEWPSTHSSKDWLWEGNTELLGVIATVTVEKTSAIQTTDGLNRNLWNNSKCCKWLHLPNLRISAAVFRPWKSLRSSQSKCPVLKKTIAVNTKRPLAHLTRSLSHYYSLERSISHQSFIHGLWHWLC